MSSISTAENSEPPSSGAIHLLQRFFGKKPETLDIENASAEQKELITNILQLGDLRADDIMIPRGDIAAISHDISHAELIEFIREHPQSRFPVYRDTLDDVLGTVHIKDLFLALAPESGTLNLQASIRDAQIIPPSMPVLTIFETMRSTRNHMMLVVDEYGGIDGLVTMGDVVEAIFGRLDDEHDTDDDPVFLMRPDGTAFADGLLEVEELEQPFGLILNDEESEDVDTVGGLVMHITGRIPSRGEIALHEASGVSFEILDSDDRRVKRVRIFPANRETL